MIKIIIGHIIFNVILFMFCVFFMLDNDSDIAKETRLIDIIICYLLCVIGIYGTFFYTWLIISRGGHLQPLL